MNIYSVDKKTRKKALRSIIKKKVRSAGFWMKLCYTMTYIIRAFAVGVAGIVSYYVWKRNGYMFEYAWSIFLLIVFYGCSFITAAIPKGKYNGKYVSAIDEQISVNDDCYEYSYYSASNGLIKYTYTFEGSNVKKIEYDNVTKELGIYADITETIFNRDVVVEKNEWSEIDILNVFIGCDLYDILCKCNAKGVDYE